MRSARLAIMRLGVFELCPFCVHVDYSYSYANAVQSKRFSFRLFPILFSPLPLFCNDFLSPVCTFFLNDCLIFCINTWKLPADVHVERNEWKRIALIKSYVGRVSQINYMQGEQMFSLLESGQKLIVTSGNLFKEKFGNKFVEHTKVSQEIKSGENVKLNFQFKLS